MFFFNSIKGNYELLKSLCGCFVVPTQIDSSKIRVQKMTNFNSTHNQNFMWQITMLLLWVWSDFLGNYFIAIFIASAIVLNNLSYKFCFMLVSLKYKKFKKEPKRKL